MVTAPRAAIGPWLALAFALALVLLALRAAALLGRLPWPVPLATGLLTNARAPVATRRRASPARVPGPAGD